MKAQLEELNFRYLLWANSQILFFILEKFAIDEKLQTSAITHIKGKIFTYFNSGNALINMHSIMGLLVKLFATFFFPKISHLV